MARCVPLDSRKHRIVAHIVAHIVARCMASKLRILHRILPRGMASPAEHQPYTWHRRMASPAEPNSLGCPAA